MKLGVEGLIDIKIIFTLEINYLNSPIIWKVDKEIQDVKQQRLKTTLECITAGILTEEWLYNLLRAPATAMFLQSF